MAERSFPLVPILLLGGLFLYAFAHLFAILAPFLLSLGLAYVANPLISYFEVRGLRRSVTVIALYLSLALCLALAARSLLEILTTQLSFLQTEAPAYLSHAERHLAALKLWVARKVPYGSQIAKKWDARLVTPLLEQAQRIPGYLLGLFPLLSLLFLIPFISFFLLIDGPHAVGSLIQACPSRYVEQALHLLSEVDEALGNYLRGIVIVAASITAASFVGLLILGVDQALAVALLSGLSSFVPYLGAAVGAVLGGLVAVIQFGTLAAGLKVVALFVGIRLADEAFLQPLIARHSVHLHPLAFLLALMIGGELFGFLGLVFGVPAVCVLKALLKVTWSWYSTEARLKPAQTLEPIPVPYV